MAKKPTDQPKRVPPHRWWEGPQPLFEDGDGQEIRRIYSRRVVDDWEYAYVTYADDGVFISAMIFKEGKLTLVD